MTEAIVPRRRLTRGMTVNPGDHRERRSLLISVCSTEGFTLLELLVSLTILAMIVATIFGTFHVAARSYEKADEIIEATQDQVYGWGQLARQVRSAYPYRSEKGRVFFKGEEDSVEFVSAYSLRWGGRRGLFRVLYEVRELEEEVYGFMVYEEQLLDVDQLEEDVDEDDYEVLFEVKTLPVFQYFDKDEAKGDSEEGKWEDSWDEDSGALPGRIAVVMGEADPDEDVSRSVQMIVRTKTVKK
jgi:prepilin-type N-terminal cleavage/methylation domain-containing protein